jgi:hypothetical protein
MSPLLDIESVYVPAFTPGDQGISYNYYLQKPADLRAASEISSRIEEIINAAKAELGVANIRPIALDKAKREELGKVIKSKEAWKQSFNQLMDVYKIPSEIRSEEAIFLPDWNNSILHVVKDDYKEGRLSLDVTVAHSYVTMLLRTQKIPTLGSKTMSISNVLITADNFIILGWRGGHNFADTIMSVPAGSIEYHTGKDPIFESLDAELMEEVGLTPNDMINPELIGKLSGGMIGGNPHYVTRVRTKKSFNEVLEHWNIAMDYREHKELLAYPDDCHSMSKMIKARLFDKSKADPDPKKIHMTTPANTGTILPQCAAAILVHYIHNGKIYENKPDFNLVRWNEL